VDNDSAPQGDDIPQGDDMRGLYTRLTQDGVDAWLDKAKLLPGQGWSWKSARLCAERRKWLLIFQSDSFRSGNRK